MITITVSGACHNVAAADDTPLLYVLLNELALGGPSLVAAWAAAAPSCASCAPRAAPSGSQHDRQPSRCSAPCRCAGGAVRPALAGLRPGRGAIANALFDATGARLRRLPFKADRVRAALA